MPANSHFTPHFAIALAAMLCFVTERCTYANQFHSESPTGVWKGEWRSQSTGHRGPMRAKIRPDGNGFYDARFTGRFALVIPFTYRVKMVPQVNSHGEVELRASKPLGPLLGSYSMSTVVRGNQLHGGFQAAQDVGRVQMQRIR